MDDLDILLDSAIAWSERDKKHVMIMDMPEFKQRLRELMEQQQQEQNKWATSIENNT